MDRFDRRLNQSPDPRQDFFHTDGFIFAAEKLESFDPATGQGSLVWNRYARKTRVAFSHMSMPLEKTGSWEFPPSVYSEPKVLPLRLDFVSPRALRLRLKSREGAIKDAESLMLSGPVPASRDWKFSEKEGLLRWEGPYGTAEMAREPWSFQLKDAAGKVLLRTHTLKDGRCMIVGRPTPFSFIRRASDLEQHMAASFKLFAGERLYGCGESFGAMDKRGQAVSLWTQDAHGTQTGEMYKPVPFYLSNRGYGAFLHHSTPMLLDFGESYGEAQTLYNGDEDLDLFLFIGEPSQVLGEYTALTGRSPLPPLWSFGLWMSRITYESEKQTREVSAKLKEHRIPCDLIHLDTGWFETDWCCDYEFSKSRFSDPRKMIEDLKKDGHRICLWQLPYFTPKNRLYKEILEQGLAVRGPLGSMPSEELVLDFSNPKTVAWYQKNLEGLLKLGVAAIKVDFGEGAPGNGLYASGMNGWKEHNLYPLRYNKAAGDIGRQVSGYPLIWARSAWAGSQRYPLHWGGDAEATDGAMLGTLRGGLSFGLCGFSFWAHDVGGFFPATPRDLYLRWLPFGAFSSHSRCHGLPPTEPWEFDAAFQDTFRKTVELRYRLMPYIWAQAAAASAAGHPMLRPLFFEFPDDPASWRVEDEYLLGSDLLVAPLFEEVKERELYLPPGEWVDLQSGKAYAGSRWLKLACGEIPALILGRGGRALPTATPALSTGAMDFSKLELWVMGKGRATGSYCAPDGSKAEGLEVSEEGKVMKDPAAGKVSWSVKRLG